MLSILASLVLAAQAPAPVDAATGQRIATLFSTIHQSEWCPAGNVHLDLATGEYRLTAGAPRAVCNDAGRERPALAGALEPAALTEIRRAFDRAGADGLNACSGGTPPRIIVGNGGARILVLTDGRGSTAAPDRIRCWTDAAVALHDALETAFRAAR
ncbi:MAG: hypothetical protein ACK4K7_13110 [Allosphingosinicella sp.]|uniref:hypothetical protein n=1 Tax=Allosphingosinicella sp. TaxID=2823234 RepID=UPI0039403D92